MKGSSYRNGTVLSSNKSATEAVDEEALDAGLALEDGTVEPDLAVVFKQVDDLEVQALVEVCGIFFFSGQEAGWSEEKGRAISISVVERLDGKGVLRDSQPVRQSVDDGALLLDGGFECCEFRHI